MKNIGLFIPLLALASAGCHRSDTANIAGHWEGSMTVNGAETIVGLDVKNEDKPTGWFSIPAQGLLFMPISKTRARENTVSFQVRVGMEVIRFEGKREENRIRGTYLLKRVSSSFQLTYMEEAPWEPGQRQEPEYVGRVNTVEAEVDGGVLYGTLREPEEGETDTVFLIIAGSGPTDRDGNSALIAGKNNSLKMLSSFLAGQGYACISYDKRGIGESTSIAGGEENSVFDDFVDDAVAWIRKAREAFGYRHVVIVGHSEGSLIGMLAAQRTEVDAFISIAGAGEPLYTTIVSQLERQSGINMDRVKHIVTELRNGNTVAGIEPRLAPLFRESVQPFLISLFKYDPMEEIASCDMPVLIVQGEKDMQTSREDARRLKEGNVRAHVALIKQMNHVLKDVTNEYHNLFSYGDPSLPLSAGLQKALLSFIRDVK